MTYRVIFSTRVNGKPQWHSSIGAMPLSNAKRLQADTEAMGFRPAYVVSARKSRGYPETWGEKKVAQVVADAVAVPR